MALNRLYLESAAGDHVAGVDLSAMEGAWPADHEGGFPLLQGLDLRTAASRRRTVHPPNVQL